MQSVLSCCLWFVTMAVSVLFFLLPNLALCHLSSALKTGSGEGRPPILSHIRVSREPQLRVNRNDDSIAGHPQSIKIKAPSYQHKILQFHSSGQDYLPSKLFVNQYPASKALPLYPVPSKFGKVGHFVGSSSSGTYNIDDDNSEEVGDSWETYGNKWDPYLLPEPEDPTFTPYIGARALTNIPKFFEHLRENIDAIREAKGRDSSSSSVAKHQVATSLNGKGEEDADKSSSHETTDMIRIATPTRRGYSSTSDTKTLHHENDIYDALTNRDSRSNPYTLGFPIYSDVEHDEKTKELLQFLGKGTPTFPKANKFNPGWLFTNLGLGKRNHLGRHV